MPTRKRTIDDEDDTDISLEGLESGGPTPEGDASVGTDDSREDGVPPHVHLAPGWFSMDVAPRNGGPIVVCGLVGPCIPLTTPAYCHNSRRWAGSALRWQPYQEWRILNSPDKVPFEPLCWMRYY